MCDKNTKPPLISLKIRVFLPGNCASDTEVQKTTKRSVHRVKNIFFMGLLVKKRKKTVQNLCFCTFCKQKNLKNSEKSSLSWPFKAQNGVEAELLPFVFYIFGLVDFFCLKNLEKTNLPKNGKIRTKF